jgi:hypothetical protein
LILQLRQINLASERKLAVETKRVRRSPLYKGGRKVPVTSEYNLRSKCNPYSLPKDVDDEQDDHDAPSSPTRPRASDLRKNQRKARGQEKEAGNSNNQVSSSSGTQRQYCTQKCLLGMVRGSFLDKHCPNVLLHPNTCKRHAVNCSKFLSLVQKQLAEDLDHNCEPSGLQGARGALFRITLASHGYVFVGKGIVKAFVPDLKHEGQIHQRLERIQGKAVPVFLGNINLLEWYYLDVGVRIMHMILMSWGGEVAGEDESVRGSQSLQWEIR